MTIRQQFNVLFAACVVVLALWVGWHLAQAAAGGLLRLLGM